LIPIPFCLLTSTVWASGGKTPSAVSTRPGPDNIEDVFTKITPQNRDQGKLRSACLARDNNRCLLSGFYDSKMALEVLSDTERQDVETVRTKAAHILPFSLSSFSESEVPTALPYTVYLLTL
jgi:hypothetical protein